MVDQQVLQRNGRADPWAWLEDRELTLAFQAGDRNAFGTIHDRHAARVESVCRRMLGNADDAQEATQETFLRVYQALGRFNGRYQMGAWITRIATNVCLDQLRARTRKPVREVPKEMLELDQCDPDATVDPETVLIRASESRRVRKVLAKLPPTHRAAIVLREYEGLSYEEIAIALGMTETQVKALLHRARQSFKRSWMSAVASALIPARLLHRFRRIESPLRERAAGATQASDVVASVGSNAVQCSTALQQCGQFVAEKVAPLAAAALVGGATVGAALVPGREQRGEPAVPAGSAASQQIVAERAMTPPVRELPARHGGAAGSRPSETSAPDEAVAPDEAPAPEQPVTEPEPEPSESPAPAEEPPSTGGGTAPPKDEEPAPVLEPATFSSSFDIGAAAAAACASCLRETAVTNETVQANEDGTYTFEQGLEGSASAAGAPSYGLDLTHSSSDIATHSARFFLFNDEGSYSYRATGTLQERKQNEWGGWVYDYSGEYELVGSPGKNRDMPSFGTYTAAIVVSWRHDHIVSSSFYLSGH